MLGPLFGAFAELGVAAQGVVYADEGIDEVRAELLDLDGVVVWVNPIQDGATRVHLDAVLDDVASQGVWVSAHPRIIRAMGTKEILYATRHLGWGSEAELYRTLEELTGRFPDRLVRFGRLVLKQARGNGGNGVWLVDLAEPGTDPAASAGDQMVKVRQAQPPDSPTEALLLKTFLARCQEYFSWSGAMVDQPYQERLAEGMIRCYFVHDEVVGFCHQWPKGLLDPNQSRETPPAPPPSVMEDSNAPAYRTLKADVEQWVPQMCRVLKLDADTLPVIWDADFLYGAKTPTGEDRYVLSEINVSAVWPYPPQATTKLVEEATARVLEAKAHRPLR
jgi:hypothetical protein